jgi:hypothetical protein
VNTYRYTYNFDEKLIGSTPGDVATFTVRREFDMERIKRKKQCVVCGRTTYWRIQRTTLYLCSLVCAYVCPNIDVRGSGVVETGD